MCRIDERVYISAEGHRSVFQDTFPCDKARKGRLCANVKKRTTTHYPKKGNNSHSRTRTPSPINPPTPTETDSYIIQQRGRPLTSRLAGEDISSSELASTLKMNETPTEDAVEQHRPNENSARPSPRDGQEKRIKPEIIIEFGERKGKGMKHVSISASKNYYKRGSFSSDASHTLRIGFPEAPLPPPPQFDTNYRTGGYNTTVITPHGYQNDQFSDSSSAQGSSQTPSLYFTSDSDVYSQTSAGSSRTRNIPRITVPSLDVGKRENFRQKPIYSTTIHNLGSPQDSQSATPPTVTITMTPTNQKAGDKSPSPSPSPRQVEKFNAGGDVARLQDETTSEGDVLVESRDPFVGPLAIPETKAMDQIEPESKQPAGVDREAAGVLAKKEDEQFSFDKAQDQAVSLETQEILRREKEGKARAKIREEDRLHGEKTDKVHTQILHEEKLRLQKGEEIARALSLELKRIMQKQKEEERANIRETERRRFRYEQESARRERKQKTAVLSDTSISSTDLDRMQEEVRAAEASKREERVELLRQQQQDPAYYNPRAGGMPNYRNPRMDRSASDRRRPSSIARQEPSPAQPYGLRTRGSQHQLLPVSPKLTPEIKNTPPVSTKSALEPFESSILVSSYTEVDVHPASLKQASIREQERTVDLSKPAILTISLPAPISKHKGVHEPGSWGNRLQSIGKWICVIIIELMCTSIGTAIGVDIRETIAVDIKETIGMDIRQKRCLFSYRAMVDRTRRYVEAAMIASGYLEQPREAGFTRLRWRCKCGDRFYGDVFEYREGGAMRLIERMQSSMETKVVATSFDKDASDQRYILRFPSWMRTTRQKLSLNFGQFKSAPSYLPQHANQASTSASAPTGPSPFQQQSLHLMACMQNGRYRRTVHQDRIDNITTDRDLFCFMGRQISKRRGYFRKAFSLKCIQGLYFVKFRLWSNGSAEIREHIPCCTLSATTQCECIPPASKVHPADHAEYMCKPAGPLDVWPPILSQQLMHMLTSPECIHEEETLVLDQLPKRTCGELEGKIREPAEGWGLHYQEGQDFDILMGVVSIGLVASLGFAILWSHFKHDVQGAFGVASYIVTAVAAIVALVVNRAGRLG